MNMEHDAGEPTEFSAEERAFIADNLASVVEYLEHVPGLWLSDVDNATDEVDVPPISAETAGKLRARVLNSIQRGDLAADTLRLGTQGMMQVLLAMVRPLLEATRHNKPDQET